MSRSSLRSSDTPSLGRLPVSPNPSLGIRGRSSNGEIPTSALGASVRAAADGHADHGRGRGHCDNRPGRDHYGTLPSTTGPRRRTEPYLGQGGALRAPRAGTSASLRPWGPRSARAGPNRQPATDRTVSSGDATGAMRCRLPRRPIVPLPAVASQAIGFAEIWTRRPLARGSAPVEDDGAEQEPGFYG